MTILIDMDGPLAQFEKRFHDIWIEKHPEIPVVLPENRVSRYLEEDYEPQHKDKVFEILRAPGFFEDIPPVEEGLEALKEMLALDLNPCICTAPLSYSSTCAAEKISWVKKHLGDKWINRTIIIRDKTLIQGKVLIDDSVQRGVMNPTWTQVWYDYPHNVNEPGIARLYNWNDWKDVVLKHL